MSKQSFVWGGITLVALSAVAVWIGVGILKPDNTASADVAGASLRVDVVTPEEPAIVSGGGQLSVGELANSYNHEETMSRAPAVEPTPEEGGTSWNDDVWSSNDGPGYDSDTAPASSSGKIPSGKDVKVTKTPSGYEG